jgi:ABC-type transport system substrate-binding protein
MTSSAFQLIFASILLPASASDTSTCTKHTLDFVMPEGDAFLVQIEDDIAADLAKIGITLNKKVLTQDKLNQARQSGDFHLVFSEPWGPPYDPVTYAVGWKANNEGHGSAMAGLKGANSRDNIFAELDAALLETDPAELAKDWEKLHQMVHESAIILPLWGSRIPAVLNNRLSGYQAGYQQYDYPIEKIKVLSGSKTVTISPGAQTRIFKAVGRMDPHSTRPNEFFFNRMVYESLVGYGADGAIVPMLATSWTQSADGKTTTFTLRTGVKFHNGEAFNCAAAKLNFDHVFAEPLRSPDNHGWYHFPTIFTGATCNGESLVITTSEAYSALMEEISFYRPLTMLAPGAFASPDPVTGNSCPAAFGTIACPTGASASCADITCAGMKVDEPYGTGPFKFVSRTVDSTSAGCTSTDSSNRNGEYCNGEVVLAAHTEYWGGAPDIETLKIVSGGANAAAVAAALTAGTIDAVIGGRVLAPADLKAFETNTDFNVVFGTVLYNSMVLINSGKAPTDDIEVRRAIIHAVNKAAMIKKDIGSDLAKAADRMFPVTTPHSDVELTPRWDYDFEKAYMLNCELPALKKEVADFKVQVSDLEQGVEASSASLLALAACAMTFFF